MRNRWSGKRRAGNLFDPFRKAKTKEGRWKVIAARFALFFLFFQESGKLLWIGFDGQGYCIEAMDSQFESGRHRAQKCSNIVMSEDCAPCWHETYNVMRISKVIGRQPDEVDQMRCIDSRGSAKGAYLCKEIGRFHLILKGRIM